MKDVHETRYGENSMDVFCVVTDSTQHESREER